MRRTLGILIAAATLTVLAGCGQPADTADAARVAAVEEATTAAAEPLTRENFADRLGAAQTAAGSSHVRMTTAMGGTEIVAEGDLRAAKDPEDAAMSMSMDLGGMSMELRAVDGVLYVNLGQLTGDKYLKLDPSDPGDPIARQFGSMTSQVDPSAQLKSFDDALVSFRNEGDGGVVDGVQTTKVVLELDTKQLLKDQADQLEGLGTKVPKKLSYVLRVGTDDDLVRQMTAEVAGANLQLDWSSWGEPVTVTAPSKSEITDKSGLSGVAGLGSLAG